MSARAFATRLLAWYDVHQRALPWRELRDPWATWVSEVMLQQTRVEVVRTAFPRFLARFPAPADWAKATDDEVLLAWKGLGYYRRARLLRAGARAVVDEHGGRVPGDAHSIATLPGVGPYTTGAIASIAFGQCVPAVDGNVERVLARHRGIDANVKRGAGARAVRAAAEAFLSQARPGDFNQALMDLGATVCTPKAPRCERCPVAADCVARRDGRQSDLPLLPKSQGMVEVHTRVALVRTAEGCVLGQRVAAGAINAGQVDLPGPGPLVEVADVSVLQTWLDERLGARALRVHAEPACVVRHGITRHRIRVAAHVGELRARRVRPPFLLARAGGATPWTTIARKALGLI